MGTEAGIARLRPLAASGKGLRDALVPPKQPPVTLMDKFRSGVKVWDDGLALGEKAVENVNRSVKVVTSVVAGGVAVKAAFTGLTEEEANAGAGGTGLRLGEQGFGGRMAMWWIADRLKEKEWKALVLLMKEQQEARLLEAARFSLVKHQDLLMKKNVGAQEPRRDAHPRFDRTAATSFLSFD